MINNQDITFVVQGPQFFRQGENLSLAAVRSIKKYYPGAQIIFSTTDTDIDARFSDIKDCCVLSVDDVGTLKLEGLNPQNSNRQIYGTFKGLQNCTTKWVCKTRSDVYFVKWFDFQKVLEKFLLFSDISKINSSGKKLVVSNVTSKRFAIGEDYLHHVSDWFYFGKTVALREIFSVPLVNEVSDNNAVPYKSCEQYIWESWAKKYIEVDESLEGAESFLVTNAIIINASSLGFKSFKRGYSIPFGVNGYKGLNHFDWFTLYKRYNNIQKCTPTWEHMFNWSLRIFHFFKHRGIIVPLLRLKRIVKKYV